VLNRIVVSNDPINWVDPLGLHGLLCGNKSTMIRPSPKWRFSPKDRPFLRPKPKSSKPNDPKIRPANPGDKGQPDTPLESVDKTRPFPHQTPYGGAEPESLSTPPTFSDPTQPYDQHYNPGGYI